MLLTLFRRFPRYLLTLQRGGIGSVFLLLGLMLPLAAQHPWERTRHSPRPGSTRSTVALDTLTARPILYALGVAEGGGEILVANGRALITRYRPDGAIETTAGFQGRAVWLLQGRVARWNDMGPVPATLTSPTQLAQFIHAVAARTGHKPHRSQPFQLRGEPMAVWWRVTALPTSGPADEAITGSGAKGRFAAGPVDFTGFLLPATTRRTPRQLHLHACSGIQPFAVHVDSLYPGPRLRLLLPALR